MPRGKFIVIEGPDGSGKSEQFKRLVARFPKGASLQTLHFPRHEDPAAYFVEEYLNGHYGSLGEMTPKKTSLFYALDRYDAGMKDLGPWLRDGKTVLVDRYVASNMGHQGAKMDSSEERTEFFRWLYELEYGILGIPKPDLNIILHVPAAIAFELRKKRSAENPDRKTDIEEGDLGHLEKAEKVYLEIAYLFPEDFTVVECAPDGKLLSIEEVHGKVWTAAQKVLGL